MDIKITSKEIKTISDTDFLLTKFNILEKINSLLINTRSEIQNFINISEFHFPKEMNLKTGKISKGENYRHLPYLILDYPSLFSNEDIFAYRTMFWWGKFFSATIQLQGKYLEKYKKNIAASFEELKNKNIYICVGDTPWEYHYEKDNYVPLNNSHKQFIYNCNFLKLSKKINLKEWNNLPYFSADFLKTIISILNKD